LELALVEDVPASERELIVRAQAGEAAAFGELVERYMRRAYFAALGLVGSSEDALDLSQEAFARAYRARKRIDPDRPFYTWFYQILRRLCFNFNRDRRLRTEKLRNATGWLSDQASWRSQEADPVPASAKRWCSGSSTVCAIGRSPGC
jgi:RNA polymerase sigma-70 factor (ECF subfamily)